MCSTMGYLFHVCGWCVCWIFYSCDKYLYWTIMFWEGIFNKMQLNKLFLEYLGGPEKGLAGQRPTLTGWLLGRLLLLRRCCSVIVKSCRCCC